MLKLLGTMTDRKVAERLGLKIEAVRRKRTELGVPPFALNTRPIERRPGLRRILTLSNAELYARYGLNPSSAPKLRREYGVTPPGWRPDPWTPEVLRQLGKEPDRVIGKRIGRSGQAVAARRKKLGIPARNPRHCWTAAEIALLGHRSDEEVGRQVGVTTGAAEQKRLQLIRERRAAGQPFPR